MPMRIRTGFTDRIRVGSRVAWPGTGRAPRIMGHRVPMSDNVRATRVGRTLISLHRRETAWRPPLGRGNGRFRSVRPPRLQRCPWIPHQPWMPWRQHWPRRLLPGAGRRVVRFGPGFGPGFRTARQDGNTRGLLPRAAQHVVHRRFRPVVPGRLFRPRPCRRVPPGRLAPCLGGNCRPVGLRRAAVARPATAGFPPGMKRPLQSKTMRPCSSSGSWRTATRAPTRGPSSAPI